MKKKKTVSKRLNVESKKKLERILKRCRIDTSDWSTRRGVKTVDHLWKEIFERECVLVLQKKGGKTRLVRRVNKVYLNVFCRRHGRLLYLREARQVFKDGGRRYRTASSRPSIGEKIKPDESPSEAFVRAMKEEINLLGGYTVSFRKRVSVKKRLSKSYPGLMSELTIYSFQVELSSGRYRKRYVEVQADKKTFFEWRFVSRRARFMNQYRRVRKALERRKLYVRKAGMLSKNGIRFFNRYSVC